MKYKTSRSLNEPNQQTVIALRLPKKFKVSKVVQTISNGVRSVWEVSLSVAILYLGPKALLELSL